MYRGVNDGAEQAVSSYLRTPLPEPFIISQRAPPKSHSGVYSPHSQRLERFLLMEGVPEVPKAPLGTDSPERSVMGPGSAVPVDDCQCLSVFTLFGRSLLHCLPKWILLSSGLRKLLTNVSLTIPPVPTGALPSFLTDV
ncbi:unnamed protein product [Arctogadus glacialis]